jgi:hypothetical protein
MSYEPVVPGCEFRKSTPTQFTKLATRYHHFVVIQYSWGRTTEFTVGLYVNTVRE